MAKKKKKTWRDYLYWDSEGCLHIKADDLGEQIFDAIWDSTDSHHPLRIVRDDPEWEGDGGVGNPKQNMQCPC